jgi:hypothetical protein
MTPEDAILSREDRELGIGFVTLKQVFRRICRKRFNQCFKTEIAHRQTPTGGDYLSICRASN